MNICFFGFRTSLKAHSRRTCMGPEKIGSALVNICFYIPSRLFIELDDGKIYRKTLYLMVKTMVSCRFSLKPIH